MFKRSFELVQKNKLNLMTPVKKIEKVKAQKPRKLRKPYPEYQVWSSQYTPHNVVAK